jgi:hypothetical protein
MTTTEARDAWSATAGLITFAPDYRDRIADATRPTLHPYTTTK